VAGDANTNGGGGDDEAAEVEFTAPSFVLKAKAPPTTLPLSKAIAAAEAAVAELAQDYAQRASEQVAELDGAFAALPAAAHPRAAIEALFTMSHNIRGEGGTFGFPLATAVAASLCSILEGRNRADETLLEAIAVHIDSLKLVVSTPIAGDGGAQGAELMAGLRKVSLAIAPDGA